ncbi:hypothetical protein ACET3Z_006215 [Daucus carota]
MMKKLSIHILLKKIWICVIPTVILDLFSSNEDNTPNSTSSHLIACEIIRQLQREEFFEQNDTHGINNGIMRDVLFCWSSFICSPKSCLSGRPCLTSGTYRPI